MLHRLFFWIVLAALAPQLHAQEKPRVLIIGDSISMGYTPFVQEMLAAEATVMRPKENCSGTTLGVEKIDEWLAIEGGKWDVIHFNFGLHDLKRIDPATGKSSNNPAHPRQADLPTYTLQLKVIVEHLKATGAKLIFATTTPFPTGVTPHRDPEDAGAYNTAAKGIAAAQGIAINNLYAFVLPRMAELQRPANVHFTPDGSKALAERVVKSIRESLKKPAAPPAKWRMVYPTWPKELAHHENIVCAQYGDRKVTLDLYHPKAAGEYPGILIIHGGGWSKGDVMSDKGLAERIALAGFVVAQVDYRLSGEAPYPAALHDCKAAIRFLRAHAQEYSLDTAQIGVIGGSAGGHLSGLTALTKGAERLEGTGGNAEQSSEVQACIVMASTMDLVTAYGEKSGESVVKFLGGTGKERPDVYREASPITHVAANSPPTLFIEGEKDSTKIGRAEMQEKLRSLGIETGLHTLKNAPHPFWMSQPWLDQTAHIAIDFFTRNLKSKPLKPNP